MLKKCIMLYMSKSEILNMHYAVKSYIGTIHIIA